MANAWYTSGKRGIGDGSLDWAADDIRCLIVNATYTFDAADDFLADIAGGERVTNGDSGSIAGAFSVTNVANGSAFNIPSFDITGVPSGQVVDAIVFYEHTGSDATARLISYIDTKDDLSPVNFTADGNNITVSAGSIGTLT